MQKFFIIANQMKDVDEDMTRKIQSYLLEHGRECLIREECVKDRGGKYQFTDASKIPEDVDAILVIGGDGTLIQAARDVVDKKIPLLGINLGKLGYLAEVDKNNVYHALDMLLAGTYEIEERVMLEGSVYHEQDKLAEAIALNDIVISRRGVLRVLKYMIYVNDEYLNSYEADGIVVATPTGSTGYSMSAGGPIIAPKASMILITPICPHTLNSRSIVLSADDKITICVEERRGNAMEEAAASFDGEQSVELMGRARVEIRMSKKRTKLIKISKDSFLQVLSKKMRN